MSPEGYSAVALALSRAAIEGGFLVLAVLLVTRAFPRLPAATRTAMWWLVTLRMVAGLAVLPALVLPVPALPAAPGALVQTTLTAMGHLPPPALHDEPVLIEGQPIMEPAPTRSFTWSDAGSIARTLLRAAMPLAVAVWAFGVLAVVALQWRVARRLQRAWQRSEPLEDARIQGWLASWLGERMAARVEIRVGAEASSPVLLAGLHPRILMPASCLALDAAGLQMVLAHEAAHIRRRDLALGVMPALAHALFWFHPLAHWAVDEYAQAREEACDHDALRVCDASPHAYGELLLAYGIDSRRHAHTAASYGSRRASQLHRRLLMLAHGIRPTSSQRVLAFTVLLAVGLLALVPLRLEASRRESRSTSHGTTRSSSAHSSSYGYSFGSSASKAESFSYGYGKGVPGGSGHNLSVSGSFETHELDWIQSFGKQHPAGFGWFRLDGKNYVVSDPSAVARIHEVMRPQAELGDRQGALGDRQGALGEKQGALGERQAELGDKQAELSEQIATLSVQLGEGRLSDARRQELQRRIRVLEGRIDTLEEQARELSAQQDQLAKQQDELGAQQDELGQQQDELGAQVEVEIHRLALEFIKTGQAVRIERR
ncbi:MAG: hypothetical protein K8R56_03690 [Candidatus Eisenbacteria bacterium]|nr:hypothetical protein [Candidatus Eisenbacteria bacterium]